MNLLPWNRAWKKFISEDHLWGGLFYLKNHYIDPINCPEEVSQLLRLLTALRAEVGHIPELRKIQNLLLWNPNPQSKHRKLADLIGQVIVLLQSYRALADKCGIQSPRPGIFLEADNVIIAESSIKYLRSLGKTDSRRVSANLSARTFRRNEMWSMVPIIGTINELLNS
ncbi:MAG: hypothetical protein PHN36_00540 [Patescibacteria group bacterium]|nr:hypothetical protein [Patescibacteria group bacterium]